MAYGYVTPYRLPHEADGNSPENNEPRSDFERVASRLIDDESTSIGENA